VAEVVDLHVISLLCLGTLIYGPCALHTRLKSVSPCQAVDRPAIKTSMPGKRKRAEQATPAESSICNLLQRARASPSQDAGAVPPAAQGIAKQLLMSPFRHTEVLDGFKVRTEGFNNILKDVAAVLVKRLTSIEIKNAKAVLLELCSLPNA